MVTISTILTILVLALAIGFAVKYRRRPGNEIPQNYKAFHGLEGIFITVMTVTFLAMFFISAKLYFRVQRPPDDALNVYATGKQWMWKFQHVGGQSEINELHVPVGRPVKLTMSSEDVIHSFFVPAFRVKRDVLPNTFSEVWFTATKTGKYHLFCTEYCGTSHSGMIGSVYVMEPADYQQWLSGGAGGSAQSEGERLFQRYACGSCHMATPTGRGPVLAGLPGKAVALATGQTVVADDTYLRESILNPRAKVVAGYEPLMPSFEGQLTEESVVQLISYIKSLAPSGAATAGASGAAAAAGSQGATGQAPSAPVTPQTNSVPNGPNRAETLTPDRTNSND
jgi:cytochrome c oxidase subunit 2